jgi:hypothetical protein
MCNFFSAVATKDKLHAFYGVDSHEDIIELAGLKRLDDKPHDIQIVRLELVPCQPMTLDFENWRFTVDQKETPDWFLPDEWRERMVEFLKGTPSVIDDHVKILASECWFCAGDIDKVIGCGSIRFVLGSATIGDVRGSATIGYVRDSATIQRVRDSATIQRVRDSATIGYVRDSATIGYVGDSATIGYVGASATIQRVGAGVTIVHDNRAKVKE